jgi:hypothetical protein
MAAVAQNTVNAKTNVRWPPITGNGVPTGTCGVAQYGMPYQDLSVTPNVWYTCGTDGWRVRGGGTGGGGGGGSLILLGTYTASGAGTLNLTARTAPGRGGPLFQGDFTNYRFIISGVTFAPATNDLQMLFSTNAGSTWDTTSTYYSTLSYSYSTSTGGNNSCTNTVNGFGFSCSSVPYTSGTAMTADFDLFTPTSTTASKMMSGFVTTNRTDVSSFIKQTQGWEYQNVNAVNAVQFKAASGIFNGTVSVYGYDPTGTAAGGIKQWSCQPGLGDGLNAVAAGTYLQSTCRNTTGSTVTIAGVQCFADAGTSTMNVAGNTLGALLTGAVTCTSSFASGTQSTNVLLTNGDYLKFTFVADGTAKQSTWVVYGTY